MDVLIDDIGSFPLPPSIDKKLFDTAYVLARDAIIKGKDITADEFLSRNFCEVVLDSFKKKLECGLDVANYPQLYDMHRQFTEVISESMNEGTYIVDKRNAVIPEVHIIREKAEDLCKMIGARVALRVCVTGPIELYLKMVGTVPYKDILLMFAETVRRFAESAVLNTKYVKTEIVSLDEPSLGFHDLNLDRDILIEVLDKAFCFSGAAKQIHLHSTNRISDLVESKNLEVISLEYAASPKTLDAVPKRMLQKGDKKLRVGISRTDINNIIAELYEKGITKPNAEQMVESEEKIRKRFLKAKEKYGEVMAFTGPDCGLGGWPTQEAAQLLLKRTVNSVKSVAMSL